MNLDNVPSREVLAGEHCQHNELDKIRQALHGLKFGSISVIVQDGLIVQIDRTEKMRIRRSKSIASAD